MKRLVMIGMLTAMSITGSMLFAAEPVTKPVTPAASAAASKDTKATSPQPAKTDSAKADVSKADAKTDGTAAKSTDGDEEKAPPATAADKGPSPQRFTPSEQVRADFDVSFPVDI